LQLQPLKHFYASTTTEHSTSAVLQTSAIVDARTVTSCMLDVPATDIYPAGPNCHCTSSTGNACHARHHVESWAIASMPLATGWCVPLEWQGNTAHPAQHIPSAGPRCQPACHGFTKVKVAAHQLMQSSNAYTVACLYIRPAPQAIVFETKYSSRKHLQHCGLRASASPNLHTQTAMLQQSTHAYMSSPDLSNTLKAKCC
jgi:hypothetical protein